MTRSGLAAATLAANDANGHRAGMLQSWNLPRSWSSASALADCFAAFRRQPVSPNAATAVSVGLRMGSGKFSMLADLVPAESGNSHTSTGNAASGRARTFIACSLPSMAIAGHRVACATTARATAPCGPSTT
jgi:hypothetical protein